MPLYEYKCTDCGSKFDLLIKSEFADQPHPCETCGGKNTSRQLSRFFANNSSGSITREAKNCSSCSEHCCANCR